MTLLYHAGGPISSKSIPTDDLADTQYRVITRSTPYMYVGWKAFLVIILKILMAFLFVEFSTSDANNHYTGFRACSIPMHSS